MDGTTKVLYSDNMGMKISARYHPMEGRTLLYERNGVVLGEEEQKLYDCHWVIAAESEETPREKVLTEKVMWKREEALALHRALGQGERPHHKWRASRVVEEMVTTLNGVIVGRQFRWKVDEQGVMVAVADEFSLGPSIKTLPKGSEVPIGPFVCGWSSTDLSQNDAFTDTLVLELEVRVRKLLEYNNMIV